MNEKLEAARKERRDLFSGWNIEKELPEAIGPYQLHRIDAQDGRVYDAFAWTDKETGWEARIVFDEETMDYMVKFDFVMFSLTEIESITGDFEEFKTIVKTITPKSIEKVFMKRELISVTVREKGFASWDYESVLPASSGAWKRTIEPKLPVHGLNGSYVIAAYERKETKEGILFFYNIYRGEYYGEYWKDGISQIVHEYDAKTLPEFERRIITRLSKDFAKAEL